MYTVYSVHCTRKYIYSKVCSPIPCTLYIVRCTGAGPNWRYSLTNWSEGRKILEDWGLQAFCIFIEERERDSSGVSGTED